MRLFGSGSINDHAADRFAFAHQRESLVNVAQRHRSAAPAGHREIPTRRSAHEIDIADAFKSVVGAADLIGTAFGHIDEMSHEIGAEFGRINEIVMPKRSKAAIAAGGRASLSVLPEPARKFQRVRSSW